MDLGNYIANSIIIDEIKRKDMPQVSGDNIPEMLAIFSENDIPFKKIKIQCDILKPIQDDINVEKVKAISKSIIKDDKMKPIIVSSDNFIIDGHHRWLAFKHLNKEYINSIKIGFTKLPALQLFNKVSNNLDEAISKNNKNIIVIFPGRFQPFHLGHYHSYKALVKKFGKENVYIATSNVTNNEKSPFNFNEKTKIISSMFSIPKNRIVQVKNPYAPKEILDKFDKENTAVVIGLGEKDANRLSGKYYKKYTDNNLNNYVDNGYIYIVPQLKLKIAGTTISGTVVRDKFSKQLFNTIYPKFNKTIFNLISSKLKITENKILDFIENVDITKIIKESSGDFNVGNIADDGPLSFYGTHLTFKKISRKRARDTGWSIINYVLGTEEEFYDHPNYPEDGPVPAVSFFPAGVAGKQTPSNQVDATGKAAYDKWKKHIEKVTTTLGWEYLNYIGAEHSIKDTKDEPNTVNESTKLIEGHNFVKCEVCGKKLRELTGHTQTHNMTHNEYKNKYPNSKFMCEEKIIKNRKAAIIAGKLNKGNKRPDLTERNKDPEFRKLISNSVKNSYTPELRKIRSESFKKKETRQKIHETNYKNGLWTRPEDKTKKEQYKDIVLDITKSNYKKYFNEIKNANKRSMEFHLDHKYSVHNGFKNNIPPEVIGHYKNFEMLPVSENATKHISNSIDINELITDIINSKNPLDKRMLLKCGGAYGHLNNLWDDWTLTFNDLYTLIDTSLEGKLELAQEKCIDGDSILVLENNGRTKIKDVVDNKIEDNVLSYDIKANKLQYRKIIDYANNGTAFDWLDIELENGHKITVTPNHSMFVKDIGYKKASELSVGTNLIINRNALNSSMISDIKINKNNTVRYDITVESLSCYFANDILVHNTDGQNIMFSWIDGKLRAARNGGHTKNFGKTSLDINGIKNMFKGRGEIQTAFVEALNDLNSAIKKLSDKQKEKIFKNGKKFMSVEIIYPQTTNVIPYNYAMLVFHGTFEYAQDGTVINSDKSDATILAGMIKQVNANMQKTFEIKAPNNLKLPKVQDFSKQKTYFNSKLKKLQKKFKLKNSDEITMYHQAWWEDFINKKAKSFKYNIPNHIFMDLIKRWAYSNKSAKIVNIRKQIDNPKFLEWVNSFDKNDHANQLKLNIEPFEHLFLELGGKILQNINVFLALNPDESLKILKKNINSTIATIRKSNNIEDIKKLKIQLKRLESAGGMENIIPSEGITFMFGQKLFKYTAQFAPINQIIGSLRYGGR